MLGVPSARWLNHLGAALEIDPELLYRHLDIRSELRSEPTRINLSYTTPFPSTGDMIQLRVCDTGSWDPDQPRLAVAALREHCKTSMRQHLEDFGNMLNCSIGDSVVRCFILHDLHNFSIQQKISIEVIHHTRIWSSKLSQDVYGDHLWYSGLISN